MSTVTATFAPTDRMTTRAQRAAQHWTNGDDTCSEDRPKRRGARGDRRSQSRRERQGFRAAIARGDWED